MKTHSSNHQHHQRDFSKMAQTGDVNKGFKGTTILLIVGVIIAVMIFVFFFFGAGSIFKFFMVVLEILMFLGILFLLAYLFYYLFLKKQKFDVNYVNKKKIIDAGTRIKRPFLKNIYVSGDKGHSRALVGEIKGYVRIQTLMRNYIYKEVTDPETGLVSKEIVTKKNERGDDIPVYTLDKQEQDVFVVKTKGLKGMFEDEMVIRVNPEDHDELVGDVTLYGFSLIPISEYWFLNTDHLDVRKIDYAILKEAERTIAFVTMTDMKELIDRATGIDAVHKKKIEGKSLVELPEMQRMNQPQNPYG